MEGGRGRGRKEEGRNSGKGVIEGVRDGKRKVREGQGIENEGEED